MTDREKNTDRFTGFADLYENARPSVPEYPVKVICAYLGKTPSRADRKRCQNVFRYDPITFRRAGI